MFEKYLPYQLKDKKRDEHGFKVVHLFSFDTPAKRQIIVELHLFSEHPLGVIKFYDKAHRFSDFRFSLMNSSKEASLIIRTTIQVMLDYYRENPYTSFAFMGAPDLDGNINQTKRFRIYVGIMSRLFSDIDFQHIIQK